MPFCCASLGVVSTVRHAGYIGFWLEVLCEDNRAIIRAASQASKAADYLLGFLPDMVAGVASDEGRTACPSSPQIAFKPDWTRHAKAAPFKRNDALLDTLHGLSRHRHSG